MTDQEAPAAEAPAVEPATDDPVAPAGADPGSGTGGPNARRWLPWALVVVFALAAVVMTWVAASLERDLDEAKGGDSDVRRAAGEFAQAFFTLDYREADRWHDDVVALATGGFREEYEEAFDGGLDQLMEQTKPVWTVAVDEILVGEESDGKANAVAVVDISQDGTGGAREIPNAYVRLSLVRVDGEWLVDDVTYPQAADAAPLDPSGGASPSTTAP